MQNFKNLKISKINKATNIRKIGNIKLSDTQKTKRAKDIFFFVSENSLFTNLEPHLFNIFTENNVEKSTA